MSANPESGAAVRSRVEQFPASRKVHVEGPGGLRVPMREISLTPTLDADGGEIANEPVRVYDTSGPYTDPSCEVDLRLGLSELRRPWIEQRDRPEILPPRPPAPGMSASRDVFRGRGAVT